jgi:hypothetical protein
VGSALDESNLPASLCHLYADRPTSEHEQLPSNPDLAAKSPQEGTEYSLDEI